MVAKHTLTAGVMRYLGIEQGNIKHYHVDMMVVLVEAAENGQESAKELLAFMGAATVRDVETAIREATGALAALDAS